MLKNKKNVSWLPLKTQLKAWTIKYCRNNSNKKGWYYLSGKKISALLRGITSKDYGSFYCLKSLHSFRTKN